MPPKKLSPKSSISRTRYVNDYVFECGNSVPIYDVTTMHGLNQILSHAKFNNREFGDVLYRGQAALYDSLTPSLFRAWNGRPGTLGRCDTLSFPEKS